VIMKTLTLPQAIIASTVLLVIGVLSFAGKDTAAYIVAALTILGALGILVKQGAEQKAAAEAVQVQTNGNTTALIDVIKEQQRQTLELAHKLAGMVPVQAVQGMQIAVPPAVDPLALPPLDGDPTAAYPQLPDMMHRSSSSGF